MKHLPKHLQPRWRYLGVGIESWPEASLSRGAFQRELWYAAQNLYGDAGSAEVDLTVLDLSFEDGVGETMVRARRGEVDRARAALACVDEVDGDPIRVRVRGVSGTVRAAIEQANPDAVLVAESRPGREGVGVAERLAEDGDASVTLTTDAAFPAELRQFEAGALVVGADRVLPDGRVVNKVGTHGSALAARAAGIPCYVVAASDKVTTDGAVDREERDPTAVYDG